ncbi:hypothetical protein HF521_010449 [Silurus meridionalis]|uniref:Selenoprotein P N-terminal domain-containing protein n=1 Tax=Silurus meridionalis TaxID=175797 RepID=A0A8T0AM84_SILME|nr:hypothetical protein HF521_010449 [Silurus meridionalis]
MRALLALCLASFPGLLWTSLLFLERSSSESTICKLAPNWKIQGHSPMKELLGNVAAKLGGLRDKLAKGNLTHVAFMIVNEQDAHSRAMYWQLKRRAAEGIPVYQQSPLQDDVWDTLQGDKDDFLVYDRCGRLTFHIMLPFSFLHYPYVEAAIRATYLQDICNCTLYSNSSSNMTTLRSFEQNMTETESTNDNKQHQHHHLHHQDQHHIHINNHSQNGSSPKPINTQTTNTKKVKEHIHRHKEHLSIIQTHR